MLCSGRAVAATLAQEALTEGDGQRVTASRVWWFWGWRALGLSGVQQLSPKAVLPTGRETEQDPGRGPPALLPACWPLLSPAWKTLLSPMKS